MPYATSANVAERLGNRVIDATSKPSVTTVTTWIEEAEAELDGELSIQGLTVPVSGTNPVAIVRAKVVSRIAARVIRAHTAGTDHEDRNQADELDEEWTDFLELLRASPAHVKALLGQAGTSGSGTHLRSHVTEPPDGEDAADLEKGGTTVTRKTEW